MIILGRHIALNIIDGVRLSQGELRGRYDCSLAYPIHLVRNETEEDDKHLSVTDKEIVGTIAHCVAIKILAIFCFIYSSGSLKLMWMELH